LLRIEGDAAGSGGLAYQVTVMATATEPELDGQGATKTGVASPGWLALAPGGQSAAETKLHDSPAPDSSDLIFMEMGPEGYTYTDMRLQPQYVDQMVEAVGVGVMLGGYLLFFSQLDRPVFLPADYVDLSMKDKDKSKATSDYTYPDREAALAAVAKNPDKQYAYYKVAGGATAPTIFSPVSTPRIASMIQRGWAELIAEIQEELVYLATGIVGGMLIKAVVNKIIRWSEKGSAKFRAKQERVRQEAKKQIEIIEERARVKKEILSEPFKQTKLGRDIFRDVRDRLANDKTLSPKQKVEIFEEARQKINSVDPSWQANPQKVKNGIGLWTGETRPFGLAIDEMGGLWQTDNIATSSAFTKDGFVLDYSKWNKL
jgi:hypothetical protein